MSLSYLLIRKTEVMNVALLNSVRLNQDAKKHISDHRHVWVDQLHLRINEKFCKIKVALGPTYN